MGTLSTELRNKLERTVVEARRVAEAGARAALEAFAVGHHEPFGHMTPEQRKRRTHLRAHARQLGDQQDKSGRLELTHIAHECAYEHWHRMLFARFLAENGLLVEPQENMAISLSEAEELAKDSGVDVWVFAARCAQRMLPQIFRPDDPLLQVSLAPEHQLKLESLLTSLPQEVFVASDSLGWVYQFWQSQKKDEVNRSEVKIGADEISAVTQLFTEPYMVDFMLDNTVGAWWAGRQLAVDSGRLAVAKTEEDCRRLVALPGCPWKYLRFVKDEKAGWRPAAGTFDAWPKTASELKIIDPCCGSGHFLVAALRHLVPIRMAEEGLSATEVLDAVLRDNLHGLEIDNRCCQIAAFALAFAAWTYPNAGEYRQLPVLHIACIGLSVGGTREQWLRMLEGQGDSNLRFFFGQLYDLLSKAPTLGSLINPHRFFGSGMLDTMGMEKLMRHVQTAIADDSSGNPEKHEMGVAAQGLARAVELLAEQYTLVITNVPYLGRAKQDEVLKEFLETQYGLGKADLATAFLMRCLEFCEKGGSAAMVTPQNWLFLATYKRMREMLLQQRDWNMVARLGPGAFETITGHVVNVALLTLSATTPSDDHEMGGVDASSAIEPGEKAVLLRDEVEGPVSLVPQVEQLKNPDAKIILVKMKSGARLGRFAVVSEGLHTGDYPRFGRAHWEVSDFGTDWERQQGGTEDEEGSGGCTNILYWQKGIGELIAFVRERLGGQALSMWIKGEDVWGKQGVAVGTMSDLKHSVYHGALFTHGIVAIVPNDAGHLPALFCYVESDLFRKNVRLLDQKVCAARASFENVPFDLPHWQKVAAGKYASGLPEPESCDPTQWLFHGRPEMSAAPLHVAVARLLGYRWPAELDETMGLSQRARGLVRRCDELLQYADDDGIVCIPSVRGEESAAERLMKLLHGCDMKAGRVRELTGGVDLDDWLRNSFFQQHCELFHHRPFVWHIWDGRKRDGFHVLVNYHRLAAGDGNGRKLLESLTYSYLGDWIVRQRDGVKRGEAGAEGRLEAALDLQKRLEAILAGEQPADIFVRWKPLHLQPIGWAPDINDGVRINIRPFLASDLAGGKAGTGILRWKPKIKWEKDRGKEPKRSIREYPWFWSWDGTVDYAGRPTAEFTGERWNDCHYTVKFKQEARQGAGRK